MLTSTIVIQGAEGAKGARGSQGTRGEKVQIIWVFFFFCPLDLDDVRRKTTVMALFAFRAVFK